MKVSTAILLGITLLIPSASSLRAEIVASNFGEPYGGYLTGFGPGSRGATAFTTADDPAVLNEASLIVSSQTDGSPAEFTLDLRTDNAGVPGVIVDTFTDQPTTSTRGFDLLTFDADFSLSAQTTYWLTLTTVSGAGEWYAVAASTSTGLWTIGGSNFSEDGGRTWLSPSPSVANRLSLAATVIPEPHAWVWILVGGLAVLGCGRHRAGQV